MRVLGIDPGYDRLGLCVLDGDRQRQSVVFSECFETSPENDFEQRLVAIAQRVRAVVAQHHPERAALETLFFSKNQKTAMRVAETRGALLLVLTELSLPVAQFSPQEVKVAVSGHGRGTKDDVADMLRRLLSLPDKKMRDDEYDAIAVALTCLVSR